MLKLLPSPLELIFPSMFTISYFLSEGAFLIFQAFPFPSLLTFPPLNMIDASLFKSFIISIVSYCDFPAILSPTPLMNSPDLDGPAAPSGRDGAEGRVGATGRVGASGRVGYRFYSPKP